MDEDKGYFGEIYIISNDVNEKLYIGQTTQNLKKRFRQHSHADSLIGKAIRKHGAEHFHIRSLEKCYSREQQNAFEIFWIRTLGTLYPEGYNLTIGGAGVTNPSEEIRKKISAAKIGRPGHPQSESAKIDIAAAQLGNKNGVGNKSNTGRKLSAEQCKKMSESQKIYYAEHPEKSKQISEKGIAYYKEHPEVAEQISEKLKDYLKNNPEVLQKRVEHLCAYREKHPEIFKRQAEKMKGNTYAKGYKHTAEELAKISAASKAYWAKKRAQKNNQRDD